MQMHRSRPALASSRTGVDLEAAAMHYDICIRQCCRLAIKDDKPVGMYRDCAIDVIDRRENHLAQDLDVPIGRNCIFTRERNGITTAADAYRVNVRPGDGPE